MRWKKREGKQEGKKSHGVWCGLVLYTDGKHRFSLRLNLCMDRFRPHADGGASSRQFMTWAEFG